MKAAVLVLAILSVSAFAKDKKADLEWKHGTLIDQSADQRHCRVDGDIRDGNGSVDTICFVLTFYEIDAGDFIYTASRGINRRDTHLDVTVNAPIEYAIRDRTLFVKDDNGKPHELRLVKKLAKVAAK